MSKRKESKATHNSDNQPKDSMNVSFIDTWFYCKDRDTNAHIFSIVRYMLEHIAEIDDSHSLLFLLLENLKSNLLARTESCEELRPYVEQVYKKEKVDKYIIRRIQSVIDNPSSLEDDKEDLLDIMLACIDSIRSNNNRKLADLRAELAPYEWTEKEIIFTLGT